MVAASLATLLLGASALVSGAPLEERGTCTFSGSSGAAQAAKQKGSCSTIVLKNVAVPAGQTLDLTKLSTGTKVIFEGTTTFGYKEWKGPLISVSGNKITVTGASGHVIDGNGAKWWDGKGTNGGKDKPKFFYAHGLKQGSLIQNLNVRNTPVQGFSINSSEDLTLDHITINNSAGDKTNGGHNTDAFDVGSSKHITISNANIRNQDDCLAINSGTDINFIGGICKGGHGISIGSVGGRKDNTVDGVVVKDSHVLDSDNGIRIKTVYGASGLVNNVTYSGVTISNIHKYGIVIQQDYENGKPTGNPTNKLPITNLKLDMVHGGVDDKATPIYLLCGSGSCKNWNWHGVSIKGGKAAGSKCKNIPSGAHC